MPKTILALAMMTRLSRTDAKRRIPEILELAGLPDAATPGTTLTPAQMRRVLLAMMLSVEADTVLVDVPLEPGRSRERFVARIHERNRAGATIVIAAENEDEIADIADRFVYLEEGRLVVEGVDDAEAAALIDQEPGSGDQEGESVEEAVAAPPARELPLSPDAERYLEYIRVLLGDRRAERARELAITKAPDDAERIEWTGVAQTAGFSYVEHLGVMERLRRQHGVTDEEPIFGPQGAEADLPLSSDATIYLEFIRTSSARIAPSRRIATLPHTRPSMQSGSSGPGSLAGRVSTMPSRSS